MIDLAFVNRWAGLYPIAYDTQHYEPYIAAGRNRSTPALRKLTEWKNVGSGIRPMPFKRHKRKEQCFQYLLTNIHKYQGPLGSDALKADFWKRTPIWSIFWHHVLFGTPIFDVYTHGAWHWDVTTVTLTKKQAKVSAPGHWPVYDRYCVWFDATLKRLQRQDTTLTARALDRALFKWGEDNM